MKIAHKQWGGVSGVQGLVMCVFIFLLAVLVPMMAAAAERSDSPEIRLRLVESELERLRTETKDNTKDEADKIDNLEKAQEGLNALNPTYTRHTRAGGYPGSRGKTGGAPPGFPPTREP